MTIGGRTTPGVMWLVSLAWRPLGVIESQGCFDLYRLFGSKSGRKPPIDYGGSFGLTIPNHQAKRSAPCGEARHRGCFAF
jgi:hypothetical protein